MMTSQVKDTPVQNGNGEHKPLPPIKPVGTTEMMINIGKLLAVLFLFLVSLKLMGSSFKLFGSGLANDLVSITTNPFISLFIGMLATAVISKVPPLRLLLL